MAIERIAPTSGSRRKAIRKQIVKILKGRTDAGEHVRAGRSETNWQETLPHVNVYIRGEDIQDDELAQAPRLLRHILNLEIEIIADGRDGEELLDRLDDLDDQVQICLSKDDTLDCTADDIILNNIEIETESEGSKPTGSIRLHYNVEYHEFHPRDARDQETLKDFKGIDAQWQVGHHDESATQAEDDRAKDTINLP